MNTKMKQQALRSALSLKAKGETIFGLKELSLSEIKTKAVADSLKSMKLADQKVLVVLPETNETATKSLRNLDRVRYTTSDKLNPYDLMSHKNVLFVADAYTKVEERLS